MFQLDFGYGERREERKKERKKEEERHLRAMESSN